MIKIDEEIVNVKNFPDGTQFVNDFDEYVLYTINNEHVHDNHKITWLYENDSEMFTLYYLVNHIRDRHDNPNKVVLDLYLPYIPNARMDRTHSDSEVFTLKYFAKFINDLKFNAVYVFDPHSNVSNALFDRVRVMNYLVENSITKSLFEITDKNESYEYPSIALYFPDEGAYKRYSGISEVIDRKVLYGKKVRVWETGEIKGLEVYNANGNKATEDDVKDLTILMIDDIISYGGTLAYSADKLKELGAKRIYAYVSHAENSVVDKEKGTFLKRLENGTVDTLFTTNSLYNSKHDKIELIHNF